MRVAGDAAGELRLRQQLVTLAEGFSDRPTEFVDSVMLLLEGAGLVDAEPGLALLSPHGALLCELARTPAATQRELGLRLGWSEGYVQKVITMLASRGFLTRTRVGQRVMYRLAQNKVLGNADSRRFALLLAHLAEGVDVEVLDSR